jgi:hypothetical protein
MASTPYTTTEIDCASITRMFGGKRSEFCPNRTISPLPWNAAGTTALLAHHGIIGGADCCINGDTCKHPVAWVVHVPASVPLPYMQMSYAVTFPAADRVALAVLQVPPATPAPLNGSADVAALKRVVAPFNVSQEVCTRAHNASLFGKLSRTVENSPGNQF